MFRFVLFAFAAVLIMSVLQAMDINGTVVKDNGTAVMEGHEEMFEMVNGAMGSMAGNDSMNESEGFEMTGSDSDISSSSVSNKKETSDASRMHNMMVMTVLAAFLSLLA